MNLKDHAARWKRDPVAFIRDVLRDPQTGKAFDLYPAERRFIAEAFTVLPDGRLRCSEIVFSAPKKSGKTAIAAMLAIYVAAVIGGPFAEVYCLSNDYEQSVDRVFEACRRIIDASPILRGSAKVTANRITFPSTGSFIQACASDYSGFAGANPSLCIFDELWGYVSERSRRLYDEAVPSPVRKVSARLIVSYAGFSGESDLLESLYRRLLAGEDLGDDFHRNGTLYGLWTSERLAPWQTEQWAAELKEQLRPNAYARLIENQWVSAESSFVSLEDWDSCTDSSLTPLFSSPTMPVWVGLDASTRHDQTGIVVCGYETSINKVRLLWHTAFKPSPEEPLDFENTIVRTLLELGKRYDVRAVIHDPWQLESINQRLKKVGIPMMAYNQTLPNLSAIAGNLYQLVRSRSFIAYRADDLRKAVLQTAITESERGFKLSKLKQSHRIDLTVALAMAAHGAAQRLGVGSEYTVGDFWTEQPFDRDESLPQCDVGFTDRNGDLLPGLVAFKERLRKLREDEERGIDVTSKSYREQHGWSTGEVTRT